MEKGMPNTHPSFVKAAINMQLEVSVHLKISQQKDQTSGTCDGASKKNKRTNERTIEHTKLRAWGQFGHKILRNRKTEH